MVALPCVWWCAMHLTPTHLGIPQVGALEHDPEAATPARHREWLSEKVIFKEVVRISDARLRAKIHQTYRMGYVKDVILPRALDDATFATLASLMLFNNVEVPAPPVFSFPASVRALCKCCGVGWFDWGQLPCLNCSFRLPSIDVGVAASVCKFEMLNFCVLRD